MSILHSSRKVGRPLEGLRAAWDIQYAGQTAGPDGTTRLVFKAPTLGQAAPRLFEQELLWPDGPKPEDTAFDLMGAVLNDVSQMKRESDRFDAELLNRVSRFDVVLRRGVKWMRVSGHHLEGQVPLIDTKLTQAARSLVQETPASRRVRLSGRLDMVRVSDKVFELVLKGGQRLRAVWVPQTVAPLRNLLGHDVTIEGQAVFRPSGSLLRVDAEAIDTASDTDKFFSTLPRPTLSVRKQLEPTHRTLRTVSPFAAIYGRWPGDESEEELLAGLEEMS